MSFAEWTLFAGGLLLLLQLAGTRLSRLPITSAMLYLAIGWILGPRVMGVLAPDPLRYMSQLEIASEVALLISLFAVGLRLGVPLRDRRWRFPLRLAFVSMTAMVAMVAVIGVVLLRLPLGAAILLGGILAPTDPVLASGLQAEPGQDPDRLGFSLGAEGGLNDGTAFPFVMLGLGLLGAHDFGAAWLRWWGVGLLWSTLAGMAVGATLGIVMGRLVTYLRVRHREAMGLDVFLGLGMIATAYGLAQLLRASGFLAVFMCGLALQRVRERPRMDTDPLGAPDEATGHSYEALSTHSHHASATMRDSVELFNGQLEKLAELTLVLLVGAMLGYAQASTVLWWFIPLVLLVLRPLSTVPSLIGEHLGRGQARMVAWFGIRGVGSVYYLVYAMHQGLSPRIATTLVSLTLWTVAASIVVHGLSADPLLRRYLRLRA